MENNNKVFPVVFCTSNEYLPYMTVAMNSIIKSFSSNNGTICFYVFYSNISLDNKTILESYIKHFIHIKIEFINVSEYFQNRNNNIGGLSVETYFRLLIPYILNSFEKVLYLDCDIICLGDISDLFKYDINNSLLACSRDFELIRKKWKHHTDRIGAKNNECYFNGGVILFNNKYFLNEYSFDNILKLIYSHRYDFLDQDILNVLCEGRVYLLPMEWNLMSNGFYRKIPRKYKEEYLTAQKNPKIIHFVWDKPWRNGYISKRSEYFWSNAKETPFFQNIASNFLLRKTIIPPKEIYLDILEGHSYGLKFIIKCLISWVIRKLNLFKNDYLSNISKIL
jgi:lipopolysaccharide biosynthesis glycosyltransferase